MTRPQTRNTGRRPDSEHEQTGQPRQKTTTKPEPRAGDTIVDHTPVEGSSRNTTGGLPMSAMPTLNLRCLRHMQTSGSRELALEGTDDYRRGPLLMDAGRASWIGSAVHIIMVSQTDNEDGDVDWLWILDAICNTSVVYPEQNNVGSRMAVPCCRPSRCLPVACSTRAEPTDRSKS